MAGSEKLKRINHPRMFKKCPKCGTRKPRSEFPLNNTRYDGLASQCKACRYSIYDKNPATRVRRSLFNRKAWINGPARDKHYRRKYGITLLDYEAMCIEQNGLCAICNRAPKEGKKLEVDHDHTTGQVRKLLCRSCNGLIGKFECNPTIFQNITAYLDG